MSHELLGDARLYEALLKFDRDLAAEARKAGCGDCGGKVHSARYPRKPRGGPPNLDPDYQKRFSFCCSRKGTCRKRQTPPSFRYLDGRHYLGAVVVLASALEGGITEKRAEELRQIVGVSVRTLRRWRKWWREIFPKTPFWKQARGCFARPLNVEELSASLLAAFLGNERERLIACLRFLLPITTRSGSSRAA